MMDFNRPTMVAKILAQLKEATESHQMGKNIRPEASTATAAVSPAKAGALSSKKRKMTAMVEGKALLSSRKRSSAEEKNTNDDQDDDSIIFSEDQAGKPMATDKSAETSMTLVGASLVLIEDIDVVFAEDKGFWLAVSKLLRTTKKPFIFTSNGN